MYKLHRTCRACGYGPKPKPPGIKSQDSERLQSVLSLGIHPLANDFCGENDVHAGFAPLELLRCPACGLAQLSIVVSPEVLYRNYHYVTSNSEMMAKHFVTLYRLICEEEAPNSILEVGSNDGKFLAFCRSQGTQQLLGVDPAENLSRVAVQNGIPTICGQFENQVASAMAPADVIVARHVFCHIDNWNEFIRACGNVSRKTTLIVLEFPYVRDLIDNCEFDTIYHEHLSYASYGAIKALLRKSDFHIHSIQHVQIHGGSVVIMLRRNDSGHAPDAHSLQLVEWEKITEDDWRQFSTRALEKIKSLQETVKNLRASGATVAGFGASAKSTVWMNCCGFNRADIQFICDNTPLKQWKFSPGTNIPITDEGALLRELPHFAVMFAWNFETEILKKQSRFRETGGKFIVPCPGVRMV